MTGNDWNDRIIGSPANAVALKNVSLGKVSIFDTTLRDGIQAPGISLGEDDIVSLAKAIDELNVDSIEIGFPASSETEKKAINRIVQF